MEEWLVHAGGESSDASRDGESGFGCGGWVDP